MSNASSSRILHFRAWLVALSVIAPVAVTVALRLSVRACSTFDLLGLPWPTVIHLLVQQEALQLVGAAIVAIALAWRVPELRVALRIVVLYLVVAIPVAVYVFMLSIFTGASCVAT